MSAPADQRRVRDVFDACVEAADCEAALERAAAGDPAVIGEVRALLALHKQTFLTLDAAVRPERGRLAPGEVVADRYRITRFLASGGMGEVYAGLDEQTGHAVALKFLGILNAGDTRARTRFDREVELARRIDHSNVCRMLPPAEHRGETVCVMELLEGETLAARLERVGALSPEEALPIAADLCEGLTAAHAAGVIHRDLKPGNVFLREGGAVIIDFGLSTAAAAAQSSLSAPSGVLGTLAYMAPEQLDGGTATARTDLYALGVIFHEMLTGQKPHSARSPFRLAKQKAREEHSTPVLPAAWNEVISRCLRADPGARYAAAAEVKRALERGRPSWRYRLRRPLIAAPLVLAAAASGGWAGWRFANADYAPAPEPAKLYRDAQAAVAQSAPIRGAMLLERAVAADPGFVQAHVLLATVYGATDQLDKSRHAALQAEAAAERRWWLGRAERTALQAGRAAAVRDFAGAAAPYRALAAVTAGSERQQALMSLGQVLAEAGKPAQALPVFETLVRENPGNTAARVRLASLLAIRNQGGRAEREFATAEKEYRQSRNEEGLADVLLARVRALGGGETIRRDMEEVQAIAARTGNQYHAVSAQFGLASLAVLERKYEESQAIMRTAVESASKAGMSTVAARAQCELGRAFISILQAKRAELVLREALAMAERAQSPGVVAQARMLLGEALAQQRTFVEAVAVMKPAIEWFRQGGYEESLPLLLIKWGTAQPHENMAERRAIFQEALDLATKTGNEMYQAMALQRLASDVANRTPGLATPWFDRALLLARKLRHDTVVLNATAAADAAGQFDRGAALAAEFEQIALGYPAGFDRVNFLDRLRALRAFHRWYRGQCREASAELGSMQKLLPQVEAVKRRAEACAGVALAANLAWARRVSVPGYEYSVSVAASEIALRAGDRDTAVRRARQAITLGREQSMPMYELEGNLLLRAATGDRALTARCLALSKEVGFDPPERFNGREDLLWLWRRGGLR